MRIRDLGWLRLTLGKVVVAVVTVVTEVAVIVEVAVAITTVVAAVIVAVVGVIVRGVVLWYRLGSLILHYRFHIRGVSNGG